MPQRNRNHRDRRVDPVHRGENFPPCALHFIALRRCDLADSLVQAGEMVAEGSGRVAVLGLRVDRLGRPARGRSAEAVPAVKLRPGNWPVLDIAGTVYLF